MGARGADDGWVASASFWIVRIVKIDVLEMGRRRSGAGRGGRPRVGGQGMGGQPAWAGWGGASRRPGSVDTALLSAES